MKCFILSTAALLLGALGASAQETAEAVGKETNFLEIIAAGGVMMYPLAIISIIGMLLVFLYLLTIRRNAVVSDKFMNNAEAMIRRRDYVGLLGYCARQNESMASVTHKTLDFFTKYPSASFGEVREVAEAEGSRQAGLLSSRITYLADIGSIAPMVGLLGTVLGMIKSFLQIANFDGVRQMELAEGVSEALITTAAGLSIGIPALVFYSLFRGRVQKYIAELEAASTHLMALLHTQLEPQRREERDSSNSLNRTNDDYAMPVPSPLGKDRPDLHGI
ncbi:MotA/TolQ/ExbB proton channel family protein [Luteolibacter sp. AS25]|uniref:MotA/TolQ/ExbB proton channel family protein n=1 Tax=Luteolibacter sp. AS25 TaxID=3135776 RepID=UPI00398ABC09